MGASTASSEGPARRSVLWISNGHGEDRIARVLIDQQPWQDWHHLAFPLVGEGHAYGEVSAPVVAPVLAMPSGGFILRQPGAFAGDVRHGLLGLLVRQLRLLRPVAAGVDLVVAVGDLLPLACAAFTGRPHAFVGCAKSDHYRDPGGEDYLGIERWFMARPACLAVYPRDGLTASSLVRRGIRAHDLGNPMMDDLPVSGLDWPHAQSGPVLGLLPGSRSDARKNLAPLLTAARAFLERQSDAPAWSVAVAVAPQIDPADLVPVAEAAGWVLQSDGGLRAPAGQRLDWLVGRFGDWIRRVRVVFGMAGTATEQCAGMGVPVVSFPGEGAQFHPDFARAQARLLGEAVQLVETPEQAAGRAVALLEDQELRARMRAVGLSRMGTAGAAARIAAHAAQLAGTGGRGTSI